MNGRRGGFQERFRTRGRNLRCRMPLIDEKAFVKVSSLRNKHLLAASWVSAMTLSPLSQLLPVFGCLPTGGRPRGTWLFLPVRTCRGNNSPPPPTSSPRPLLPRCLMQACMFPPVSMSAGVRSLLTGFPQASWMTPQPLIPPQFASRTSWRITPLYAPSR